MSSRNFAASAFPAVLSMLEKMVDCDFNFPPQIHPSHNNHPPRLTPLSLHALPVVSMIVLPSRCTKFRALMERLKENSRRKRKYFFINGICWELKIGSNYGSGKK